MAEILRFSSEEILWLSADQLATSGRGEHAMSGFVELGDPIGRVFREHTKPTLTFGDGVVREPQCNRRHASANTRPDFVEHRSLSELCSLKGLIKINKNQSKFSGIVHSAYDIATDRVN